ncbi:hypothetical protein [Succinivibrio dextrinosolvens]|uniref:Uncharacterized protein n=1 Tax=Succinivibrio dextrinosolvens TaxID=83771 RepID=A0A662ZBE1_9GAMM|nr:hypothetical protein [Succinivibrio dextrinosolvens]SFK31855.1 hypothetical protein SAMN04487865_10542 [Succinivibrio dextrinosolvens]
MDEAKTVTEDELRNFILHTENMFSFDVTDKLEKIKTESFVIGSKADKVFDYELLTCSPWLKPGDSIPPVNYFC